MPYLYGQTPQFGIASAETGILIEGLDFDASVESVEQKDHQGQVVGVNIVDQKLTFSMNGAEPLSGSAKVRLASTITLSNACPDYWIGAAPAATTQLITGIKQSQSNTAAAKKTISGTIYAFGASEVE